MKRNMYVRDPYVSFILRGKDIDPQDITNRLGIKPSRSFKKGDYRSENKKWPHGYWELESTSYIESDNLRSHIEWLIDRLTPVKTDLKKLFQDISIESEISCFWILSKEHAGLELSHQLLNKIVDLGLKLELDIYCAEKYS
ncbi:MAG: DUF4279 domain-containing protein [Chloroflexi bacterium]|nr:DUF4279 domain-containing protein [Chloroflexota bacterium]